jgi:RimJ/RimL family protein N-acetyltransferase
VGRSEFRPPVTLEGRFVRLVPLAIDLAPGLAIAGDHPEIWTYVRTGPVRGGAETERHVATLLAQQAAGTDLPFAVLRREDDRPIGMTRFLGISREDRTAEIGGTWYDPAYWRTPVNTESKYLLLRYAFEQEAAHRIQIKTDLRNLRSQRAIERLGAVREGVLREHLLLADGHLRSSVFYSILESEWPDSRRRLLESLARPWPPTLPGSVGPL